MIRSSVARRYAKALFELLEPKSVEPMRGGLQRLSEAIAGSGDLKHIIASPAFSVDQKMAVLIDLSKKTECPPMVKGFLSQLVAKNRVDELPSIADAFAELADQARGVQQVEVKSASKLGKPDRDRIQRRLGEVLGGEVSVSYLEDPKLISGLTVKIGSAVYDSTIGNRLQAIRASLTKE